MPPKTKFRKKSTALVKRVKALEIKQKADDKNTERKVQYHRQVQTLSNIWANYGSFILRTNQGTSGENVGSGIGTSRIGNTVNLRSQRFKFFLNLATNSDGIVVEPNTGTICRILLVDNLTDDTTLQASDVLQDTAYKFTSPYKNAVAGGKRYRVLMDKTIKLTGQKPHQVWSYKMPLPKSGRVLHYNGNTAYNPSDCNVSLIYACESISTLSPNKPILNMYSVGRFEDC